MLEQIYIEHSAPLCANNEVWALSALSASGERKFISSLDYAFWEQGASLIHLCLPLASKPSVLPR